MVNRKATARVTPTCRICGGTVQEFIDLGRQPVSNGFVTPEDAGQESYFRLAAGFCTSCAMVQQLDEFPRDAMFHQDYPYRSSESAAMSRHFEALADRLLRRELTREDPFVVEIGCNDGIMLKTLSANGVRHLGVDPSRGAAGAAADKGVRVRVDFFEESTAAAVRAEHGAADVIFSANTISHISYLDSIFGGVDSLLAPDGVFILEDRYLGDIIEHVYFDQLYDEHFYLFSVQSVAALAARFGFVLADVEHLPVHGGSLRYTIAREGARRPSAAVWWFLDREQRSGLTHGEGFARLASQVEAIRTDLVATLSDLRSRGQSVVGYGATSKSATVINYCGIGPDLIPFICDSTPEKQGRLTPGSHIPVRGPEAFASPYPDYAVLFAWNHADEIMAKERQFGEQGGQWIFYMPDVRIVPAAATAAAA